LVVLVLNKGHHSGTPPFSASFTVPPVFFNSRPHPMTLVLALIFRGARFPALLPLSPRPLFSILSLLFFFWRCIFASTQSVLVPTSPLLPRCVSFLESLSTLSGSPNIHHRDGRDPGCPACSPFRCSSVWFHLAFPLFLLVPIPSYVTTGFVPHKG